MIVIVALSLLFLVLYNLTLTYHYSYDALCYALDMEFGTLAGLFHPNHVLYSGLGKVLWKAAVGMGYATRALFLMQRVNAVVAALAVAVLAWTLIRRFGWAWGVVGAALFGVSQAFWIEVVDGGCYAWASLATCVLFALFIHSDTWAPFWLGVWHGVLILFHQLLVLATPAFLLKLERKKRIPYLAGLGVVAGGMYAAIATLFYGQSFHQAMRWMLGPARQPHGTAINFFFWFSFDFWHGLGQLWEGLVRAIVAPVTAHASVSAWLEQVIFALIALFVVVLDYRSLKSKHRVGEPFVALWVWVLTMNLFLLFYIPGAPRFRLMFLPVLIYLALEVFARFPSRGWGLGLAGILVAAVAFINFRDVIRPDSQPENNPHLLRTWWVAHTLKPGDTFLFKGRGSETIVNVYVAYFAPHIHGRSFRGYFFENPQGDLQELTAMVQNAQKAHQPIYIESTLFNPETQAEIDTMGKVPPGTVHAWMGRFRVLRELKCPDGYTIAEVR